MHPNVRDPLGSTIALPGFAWLSSSKELPTVTLAATNGDGPACSALRDEGDEPKDVELGGDGTRSKRRRPSSRGERWQMAGWWFTWELG